MRTLILYTFHVYNENVNYFIKNGIFEHPNYDFILIHSITGQGDTTREVKKGHIFYRRKNIGFDFGAWSEILIDNNLHEEYDNYIFLNSSCRGPFVKDNTVWPEIFIDKLNDHDRLVGTTINCANNYCKIDLYRYPHVQSWCFCMNKETLKYLIKCGIFSKNYISNKIQLIDKCEIGMSRAVIGAGWNISCLMKDYNGVDFTWKKCPPQKYGIRFMGDVAVQNGYHRKNLDPYDVVFVKANRNISY